LIGKQNLYEHSVRVPLVISGPGVPANVSSDAMCYLFDVFPTLGALCGVPAPQTSEGIDFSGALLHPGESGRETLRFAYKDVQQALCDAEWKYINYPKAGRSQLFNLKQDPAETRDLSALPEHKERVERMHSLLSAAP
jgi:arylsulfatase A-like enzyme